MSLLELMLSLCRYFTQMSSTVDVQNDKKLVTDPSSNNYDTVVPLNVCLYKFISSGNAGELVPSVWKDHGMMLVGSNTPRMWSQLSGYGAFVESESHESGCAAKHKPLILHGVQTLFDVNGSEPYAFSNRVNKRQNCSSSQPSEKLVEFLPQLEPELQQVESHHSPYRYAWLYCLCCDKFFATSLGTYRQLRSIISQAGFDGVKFRRENLDINQNGNHTSKLGAMSLWNIDN